MLLPCPVPTRHSETARHPDTEDSVPSPLSRRAFTQRLGLLAAAPLALFPPGLEARHAVVDPGVSGPSPDATSLAQIVNNRWGENLTAEQLAQITQSIDGNLRTAAALHEVPLSNADGPDFVFRPYRSED